jgi:three-Cys-motif partner protein
MDIFERLNSVSNPSCHKHCNAEKRDSVTENEICGIVSSVIDGLPVRCVGEWAYEKINLLVNYFGAFTVAMKGKWSGGINYIEICSGPGRCMDRSRGREFDGTSLAILHHKEFSRLSKAIFFDADMNVVDTLNKRILGRHITSAKVFNGDYYNAREICKRLATEIQKSSLNLVFIDPTDCSVPFDLIRSLKETIPKMDLIINVASMTDFNRNVGNVFLQPESYIKSKEKYVRFLGSEEFFGDTANLKNASHAKWGALRKAFRETYQKNLKELGFKHFDIKIINGYYDILFTSESETGYKIWKKTSLIGVDGQRQLPL